MTSMQPGHPLNDTIRRYRTGAGGFMAWWKQSLLAWLPARWQERFGLAQERLLITHQGEQLQLQWQNLQGLHDLTWRGNGALLNAVAIGLFAATMAGTALRWKLRALPKSPPPKQG